ncbi:substrate-binding periplasmic protein [Zooshikella harenae]|uniref:Transporter substrate-binding domain-containing protein n=1 Tax=Zooshikella harenae TaxID=2827238 RepID=A0ABS5ZKC1_9GAMM|nr:transporter substrate-binding domain-containing protein [Zooshikella harenae]MBU2713686.1 transporter substrate-binding domain-containing protein [Zooshikella harenae]
MKHLFLVLIIIHSFSVNADDLNFVTLEFPPIAYTNNSKEVTGFAVEAVKRISDKLGYKANVKVLPWTRGLNMVKDGEADAIFTIYKNKEREGFIDFTQEIFVPQTLSFYINASSSINPTKNIELDILKKYKIGVVSTISYGKKFDNIKSDLNLSSSTNLLSNFKKLMARRVDIVPSNTYVGDYTLSQNKPALKGKVIKMVMPFDSVPSYIGFSKKKNMSNIRDQFDQELRKMNSDDWVKKSMLNYQ